MIVETAKRLTRLGLSVFPIKPGTKTPAIAQVTPYRKRFMTDREIEKYFPGKDIGLICGKLSGIMVYDGDSLEGIKWLEKNIDTQLKVKTRNGIHFYTKYIPDTKNLNKKLHPGVDIKTEGGYVVMPPSKHYDWLLSEPTEYTLNSLPSVDLMKKTQKYYNAVLEKCLDEIRNCPVGQRNDRLNKISYRLSKICDDGHLDHREVMLRLEEAGLACGLTPSETRATIRSGFMSRKKEKKEPEVEQVADEDIPDVDNPVVVWVYHPDIQERPKPRDPLYLGLLANTTHLLAGPAKSGKSTVAGIVSAAVATGIDPLTGVDTGVDPQTGEETDRTGPVLWVTAEEHIADARWRVEDIAQSWDIRDGDLPIYYTQIPRAKGVPIENLKEKVEEVKPHLVVFDTLPAILAFQDENKSTEWNMLVPPVLEALDTGEDRPAILALHHAGKARRDKIGQIIDTSKSQDFARGSSAAAGIFEAIITVAGEPTTGVWVRRVSARFAGQWHCQIRLDYADNKITQVVDITPGRESSEAITAMDFADEVVPHDPTHWDVILYDATQKEIPEKLAKQLLRKAAKERIIFEWGKNHFCRQAPSPKNKQKFVHKILLLQPNVSAQEIAQKTGWVVRHARRILTEIREGDIDGC